VTQRACLRALACAQPHRPEALSQQTQAIAVVPRFHNLAARDAMDVHSAHCHLLPTRLYACIRCLQRAGVDPAGNDQVTVSKDILDVIMPIRERRAIREQTLLVHFLVLLRDDCAMMRVVVCQQFTERIGITSVEGIEVGLSHGDRLFRRRGRARGRSRVAFLGVYRQVIPKERQWQARDHCSEQGPAGTSS
jgi:hypothetical protein